MASILRGFADLGSFDADIIQDIQRLVAKIEHDLNDQNLAQKRHQTRATAAAQDRVDEDVKDLVSIVHKWGQVARPSAIGSFAPLELSSTVRLGLRNLHSLVRHGLQQDQDPGDDYALQLTALAREVTGPLRIDSVGSGIWEPPPAPEPKEGT